MNECDYPGTKAYLIGCSDEGLEKLFTLVTHERNVRRVMRDGLVIADRNISSAQIMEARRRKRGRDSTETADNSGNSDRTSDKGVSASQPDG